MYIERIFLKNRILLNEVNAQNTCTCNSKWLCFSWIRLFEKTLSIFFNISYFVHFWVIFNFFLLRIFCSFSHQPSLLLLQTFSSLFFVFFWKIFLAFQSCSRRVLSLGSIFFCFFLFKGTVQWDDPAEIRLIRIFIKGSVSRFFRKIRLPPILSEPCKVLERLLVFKFAIVQQFRWLRWIFIEHLD